MLLLFLAADGKVFYLTCLRHVINRKKGDNRRSQKPTESLSCGMFRRQVWSVEGAAIGKLVNGFLRINLNLHICLVFFREKGCLSDILLLLFFQVKIVTDIITVSVDQGFWVWSWCPRHVSGGFHRKSNQRAFRSWIVSPRKGVRCSQ